MLLKDFEGTYNQGDHLKPSGVISALYLGLKSDALESRVLPLIGGSVPVGKNFSTLVGGEDGRTENIGISICSYLPQL